MAAAGLAFDIGRFYSERRYLQNAADAGALAIANALIRGENGHRCRGRGSRRPRRATWPASPTGTPASVATTPEYAAGHAGDPVYLTSGILITSSGDVRVAVKSDVTYTFGRVIGLGSAVIGGQARVASKGDLLPIAVRHYVNAPGPFAGAVAPCDGNMNHFQDLVATANTSCLGSTTDASLRSTPNPGCRVQRGGTGRQPVQPRADHRPRRPGRHAVERGQLPRLRDAGHPQLRVPVAAVKRLLQRRDGRHECKRPQGHGGGLGRGRLPRAGLPARGGATGPQRPGGHHRRQLDRHRRRRDRPPLRPRGGDPGRRVLRDGPEHPGLRLRGRLDRDHQHQPEPQQHDHDERDEERFVHGRRPDLRRARLERSRQSIRDDAPAADVQSRPRWRRTGRSPGPPSRPRGRRRASTASGSRAIRPTRSCSTTTTPSGSRSAASTATSRPAPAPPSPWPRPARPARAR